MTGDASGGGSSISQPVRTRPLGSFKKGLSLIVHGQPIGNSVEGEELEPDLLTLSARRVLADAITPELASSHALSRPESVVGQKAT